MPSGVYPNDHKHEKARGLSRNKYDTKGNLRKPRKSRAKDPERFKKAIEEKTGLTQLYPDNPLGKIVHTEGLEEMKPFVDTKQHIETKVKSNFVPFVNPFTKGTSAYEQLEGQKELGRYWGQVVLDPNDPDYDLNFAEKYDVPDDYLQMEPDTRALFQGKKVEGLAVHYRMKKRKEFAKEYEKETQKIGSVKDLTAKEVVEEFDKGAKHRGTKKYVVPSKLRKQVRELIKTKYADEYGVNRAGELTIRTRARAKTQQEKIEEQNKSVSDFFSQIEMNMPKDDNSQQTLGNIQMKIAQANTPVNKPPISREDILKKARLVLTGQTESFVEKVKKYKYANIMINPLEGKDFSHLGVYAAPPEAPKFAMKDNTDRGSLPRVKTKYDALPTTITSINPSVLPIMGNPLPTRHEYIHKVDKGQKKKIKKIKKKLVIVEPKQTEPQPQAEGDGWETTFKSGYSAGYAIKGGAKANNFLTLADAKAKAKEVEGVRAITKYKARGKTMYSLRGSLELRKAPEGKTEMTIFYK